MKPLSCIVILALGTAACAAKRDSLAVQSAQAADPVAQASPAPGPNGRGVTATPGEPKAQSSVGASAAPPDDVSKAIPKDAIANGAIDGAFQQWSSGWMFDRYIPGSARAANRALSDGAYVIRGVFDFVRGGAKLTIPFAAAFTNGSQGYRLSNLCYNDTTTGMTDCTNPSDPQGQQRAMLSRQFLGSIVALGLIEAMTTDTRVCERHTSFFGDDYYYCH
jgi:hypothetical protein